MRSDLKAITVQKYDDCQMNFHAQESAFAKSRTATSFEKTMLLKRIATGDSVVETNLVMLLGGQNHVF